MYQPVNTRKFKDIMPDIQSQRGRAVWVTGTDDCFSCSLSPLLIIYQDTGLDHFLRKFSDIVSAYHGWLGYGMGETQLRVSASLKFRA